MLIEERTLFRVSAAPMFVPAWDPEELARPDLLLTGLVPIQVGTLEPHDGNIVRVAVHPRFEPRRKFGEGAMRPFVGIPPDRRRGSPWHPLVISDFLGTGERRRILFLLPLPAS